MSPRRAAPDATRANANANANADQATNVLKGPTADFFRMNLPGTPTMTITIFSARKIIFQKQ